MELAMLLNGLMASPTFADWIQGQPLDIDGLLYGPSGKPQVSILYIAHLSEAEKQFFVTLLLEQVVSWMRAQSGTTSLRALVYMDEMFGYLPPHPANPPTKKPLLTLLKQARAFGLGLILATQNPVDLDYKALSNAGTWFIGRMQTDRDKQRLLDGLEGVEVGKGGTSRAEFDRMISALKSRVFLLHNVHEERAGGVPHPLGHELPARPADPHPGAATGRATAGGARRLPSPAAAPVTPARTPAPSRRRRQNRAGARIALQPGAAPIAFSGQAGLLAGAGLLERCPGTNWPATGAGRCAPTTDQEGYLVYEPALVGLAKLRFAHTKSRQTHTEDVAYLLPVEGEGYAVDWAEGKVQLEAGDLDRGAGARAPLCRVALRSGRIQASHGAEERVRGLSVLQLVDHAAGTILTSSCIRSWARATRLSSDAAGRQPRRPATPRPRNSKAKYETRVGPPRRQAASARSGSWKRTRSSTMPASRRSCCRASNRCSAFLRDAGRHSRLSSASRKRRMTRQAKADVKESEEVIEKLEERDRGTGGRGQGRVGGTGRKVARADRRGRRGRGSPPPHRCARRSLCPGLASPLGAKDRRAGAVDARFRGEHLLDIAYHQA